MDFDAYIQVRPEAISSVNGRLESGSECKTSTISQLQTIGTCASYEITRNSSLFNGKRRNPLGWPNCVRPRLLRGSATANQHGLHFRKIHCAYYRFGQKFCGQLLRARFPLENRKHR